MNIFLAVISTALLWLISHWASVPLRWLHALLWSSVEINLILAILNLWPIPPLDGSKIAVGLLPPALAIPLWKASRFGMIFVLMIFFVAPMAGIDVFGIMVGRPVLLLEHLILALLGVTRP